MKITKKTRNESISRDARRTIWREVSPSTEYVILVDFLGADHAPTYEEWLEDQLRKTRELLVKQWQREESAE